MKKTLSLILSLFSIASFANDCSVSISENLKIVPDYSFGDYKVSAEAQKANSSSMVEELKHSVSKISCSSLDGDYVVSSVRMLCVQDNGGSGVVDSGEGCIAALGSINLISSSSDEELNVSASDDGFFDTLIYSYSSPRRAFGNALNQLESL